MWAVESLVNAAAAGLRAQNERLDAEQAVHGLDAAPEVELHAWVAEGLAAAGYGVWPEVPYPGEPARRPRRSERERCDLVLTPSPDQTPADPVADLLERDAAAETLFADTPTTAAAGALRRATPPEEAFWLEIKVVHQFAYTNGITGPNRTYASELTRGPTQDAAKLAADPGIIHAGVLVVLFAEDEATAEHDLGILTGRLLDRDLPINMPVSERFALCDRIGNRLCIASLYRLRASSKLE